MAKSGIRLIKKPPPAGRQYDFFRKEVKKNLEGRGTADRRPEEYNKAVGFFQANHRPDFKSQVVFQGDKIFIRTILTNGSVIGPAPAQHLQRGYKHQ